MLFHLLFTFYSLILCFFAECARIRRPEVHHLKGYKSPLDEGVPVPIDYYYSDGAENVVADEDFPVDGSELFPGAGGMDGEQPLCTKECQTKFNEAMKMAMQSNNNFDRFMGVCRHYNDTIECMDELQGEKCSNQETFHVFTSGIRYMCIEQKKAFDAVMECVDAQANGVEKECEEVCHVKERMAHWAVQSGLLDNFMQGALSSLANGETFASQMFGGGANPFGNIVGMGGAQRRAEPSAGQTAKSAAESAAEEKILKMALQKPQGPPFSKRITPDFMRAVVQDGCELMRCQLICMRVKFDAKCGNSAGTLLSEAFVRPIAQAQEFLTYGTIAPFASAFLPHQCDFMVKREVLNEFRIPPELDDALHRKYDGDDEQKLKGEEGGKGGAGGSGNGDEGAIADDRQKAMDEVPTEKGAETDGKAEETAEAGGGNPSKTLMNDQSKGGEEKAIR